MTRFDDARAVGIADPTRGIAIVGRILPAEFNRYFGETGKPETRAIQLDFGSTFFDNLAPLHGRGIDDRSIMMDRSGIPMTRPGIT